VKRPALWLAAFFAIGVALGESRAVSSPPSSSAHVAILFAAIVCAVITGLALHWRNHLATSLAAGFLAWALLGIVSVSVERASVSPDLVTTLAAQGRLDLSSPHRWIGRLHDDPLRLPWGTRLQIDLESVESPGESTGKSMPGWRPVHGGLRLNYYSGERQSSPLPNLRAGDRMEILAAAHEPRNFLDPGAFDLRGYLAHQGVDLTGTLRAAELLRALPTPFVSLAARVARYRGTLLARADALFTRQPNVAAIVRAMVLGDRSFVDSDLALPFQQTGAYHVLVVAGLHVGIFLAFIYWITRLLRLRLWPRTIVAITALAAYTAIVQDRTPVLRAALMAAIFLIARPFFRRVDLLQTVSLAALILLFWRPSLLGDSSFQLSFLAVAVVAAIAAPWLERTTEPWLLGLRDLRDVTRDVTFAPRVVQFRLDLRAAASALAAWLPSSMEAAASTTVSLPIRFALRLWELFVISLALQIGMLPLMASYFHRMTLAAPLSNIPAVLLTGLIVPLAFITLAVSAVSMRVAAWGAWIVSRLVSGLLASVRYFADWPHAAWRIPDPPVWVIGAFLALLALLAMALEIWRGRQTRHARVAATAAAFSVFVLAVLIAVSPFAPLRQRGDLEVTTLDVGQGDSLFVMFPAGQTMLVDGGGLTGEERVGGYHTGFDVGEQVISPYLWQRRVKHLDVVMLTHAHHDHMDGLHAILRNFRVGELWVGRDAETPPYQDLLAEARADHIRIVHRKRGATFQWGNIDGQILWPPDNDPVEKPTNNDSVVLLLADGAIHFLLAGDVEHQAESAMVSNGQPLRANFLKVPHHGSKTSSTPDFLRAVSPTLAAISVGENNTFGLPNPGTLDRLKNMGIRYWSTAQAGAITVLTDGHSVSLHTFAGQN
jgi:competence protein ComEC